MTLDDYPAHRRGRGPGRARRHIACSTHDDRPQWGNALSRHDMLIAAGRAESPSISLSANWPRYQRCRTAGSADCLAGAQLDPAPREALESRSRRDVALPCSRARVIQSGTSRYQPRSACAVSPPDNEHGSRLSEWRMAPLSVFSSRAYRARSNLTGRDGCLSPPGADTGAHGGVSTRATASRGRLPTRGREL